MIARNCSARRINDKNIFSCLQHCSRHHSHIKADQLQDDASHPAILQTKDQPSDNSTSGPESKGADAVVAQHSCDRDAEKRRRILALYAESQGAPESPVVQMPRKRTKSRLKSFPAAENHASWRTAQMHTSVDPYALPENVTMDQYNRNAMQSFINGGWLPPGEIPFLRRPMDPILRDVWPALRSDGKPLTDSGKRPNHIDSSQKVQRVLGQVHKQVPKLHHGLDSVLFKPGFHWCLDPKTGESNFPGFTGGIVHVDEVDFTTFAGFTTPGEDMSLRDAAQKWGKRFRSSTSSLTPLLSQLCLAIGAHSRHLNLPELSDDLLSQAKEIAPGLRTPVTIHMRPDRNQNYTIDISREYDLPSSVLAKMGHPMERMLTLDAESFDNNHLKKKEKVKDAAAKKKVVSEPAKEPKLKPKIEKPAKKPKPEIEKAGKEPKKATPNLYTYTSVGNVLMRAQLDCQHDDLPRKSFDIKTRASRSIRFNTNNYEFHAHKKMTSLQGLEDSYERELLDLCRSALLKYQFQVLMGAMDGIFVAFHNTRFVSGFQYMSLDYMSRILHGKPAPYAVALFSAIVQLLDNVLSRITNRFPDQKLTITFALGPQYAKRSQRIFIYVEPGSGSSRMQEVTERSRTIALQVYDPFGARFSPREVRKFCLTAELSSGDNVGVSEPIMLSWGLEEDVSGSDQDKWESLFSARRRQYDNKAFGRFKRNSI